MVHAFNGDVRQFERGSQPGTVGKRDLVREKIALVDFRWKAVVLDRTGFLRPQILIERTAERDVDHLESAAQAEDGLVILDRPARELELDRVARRIDPPAFG